MEFLVIITPYSPSLQLPKSPHSPDQPKHPTFSLPTPNPLPGELAALPHGCWSNLCLSHFLLVTYFERAGTLLYSCYLMANAARLLTARGMHEDTLERELESFIFLIHIDFNMGTGDILTIDICSRENLGNIQTAALICS